MTKANITQYSSTPSSNTDINDINIAENCPASGLNNAIRELMAHLKNVDTGSQALTALSVTGVLTANGGAVFNEASADVDFRVESNGQANMLLVDGGNDTVSFQPNSASLTIKAGSADATNNIRLEAGGTTSTYLEYRGYLGHRFYVDTTEQMKIDATGAVTMPSQPSFLARPASQQTNIAVGSTVVVVFGTEVFDRNADFSSNAFTAPLEGLYQFNASLRIQTLDSASSYYYMNIRTSNRDYQYIFDPDFGQDNDYYTMTVSCLADMDANDTADVILYQGSGTAQTDIQTISYFTGYLVC